MNASVEEIPMPELESKFPTLTADQGWTPSHCQPLSTVAVIVPFRDREEHLRIFLNNLIQCYKFKTSPSMCSSLTR